MGAHKTLLSLLRRRWNPTALHDIVELDSKAEQDGFPTLLLPRPSVDSEAVELILTIPGCDAAVLSPSELELKHQKLSRILSYVRSAKTPFHDFVLSPLAAMLSSNLFRPLPPPLQLFLKHGPNLTLALPWRHLKIVYDIFMALVANAEPKALSRHVDHGFLRNLVALFQSEDSRERDRLTNAFHKLYTKLTAERSFMRKLMNDAYLQFLIDGERHPGIGNLLEISGSIIEGLDVPLKMEHKLFLRKVLMPLHKPRDMDAYHEHLAFCVLQLVKKDRKLCEEVVKGVLRHWPVTNCKKEVLLLGELMDLVENNMNAEEFSELALPICSRIAKCSTSTNSEVAKKALHIWDNEQFLKMACQCWEVVLPVTVEAIENNLRCHWSNSIRELTASMKRMLEAINPALYSKHQQQLCHREAVVTQEQAMRDQRWEKLEITAAAAVDSSSKSFFVHGFPQVCLQSLL